MLKKSVVLLFGLCAACTGFAQKGIWSVDGTLAMTTSYFPELRALKNVTFAVDWDRQSACRPTINVYLMSGDVLGPLKSVVRAKNRMTVKIGDKEWSGDTIIGEHEGGFALIFYAQDDLISRIPKSTQIAVKVMQEMPWMSFDGVGSDSALSRARKNCR